jgi:excisionase family DNA binding protein
LDVLMHLLTLIEVAERLGTSERHVRRLIADHRLASYKVGGLRRVAAADLDAWLTEQRQSATA